MQVQACDVTRCVDGIRLREHGALGPDSQSERHAVVGEEMRRAVRITGDGPVAAEIGDEPFERLGRVDAPHRLAHARLVGVGRRQRRIVAVTHDDLRARSDLEHGFRVTLCERREAEVGPESCTQRHVVDAEDRAFNAEDCHGVTPSW